MGAGPANALQVEMESRRRELIAYCYRMLGSNFEAEDAVQETMVRAWRAIDGFEGRSSVRSWLYRIATNVCIDMARGPQRRTRPMDLGPASTVDSHLAPGLPEATWITPIHDREVVPTDGDPAEIAAVKDSIRLAFVAALQHLPPRQRAVLILRQVLNWHASEVAELLDTSVASVNSALQRARATLADIDVEATSANDVDDGDVELLAAYVDAFERYDIAALVALLRDDVEFNMPPYALWLQGPESVAGWLTGPGAGCEGSRLVRTEANGGAAIAQYRIDPAGGWAPWGVIVLELSGGQIARWTTFLGPEQFEAFGLPLRLDP